MRKIGLLTLLLLLTAFTMSAQDFRLGKVSKEELKEKKHPVDTSAAAAYLYKTGKTYFRLTDSRFYMVTEVECRIKIYKKEGYEYATEEIPFYTGGRSVKLTFNDAYTYNLVGDKIEKTKLKSDGEFEEQINENYSVKKITMPNVKEGSVIEYQYTITTPYFTAFPDWYFQYPIPANNVSYEVAIPSYFTYNRYMSGYISVEKSAPKTRVGATSSLPEVVTTFSVKNVKALKDESYVNNIDNYLSILRHELASVQFPNEPMERFSTDWPSVAKTIYDDEDFGRELNHTNYFKEDIDALIAGLTPYQRVTTIFEYVKSRMNWNEKNGYYCIDGVKRAYEAKVGNTGEINLMLTSMLRYAKVDANPVLVSTRSNGVALFPTRTAYNYVIAGVKIDNELLLLDATSKNSLPNILPVRTLNWVGRMIMSNGNTEEVDLMPKKNSREVINISAVLEKEGKVTGKVRDQYFDHYAYSFRENYTGSNKDSYIENMEKRYKGITVNDYTITNDKELIKPIVENFDFVHESISEVIGNKIYISPMLFYTETENPFKAETREYPIDFVFPHQDKFLISITIPEGYVVESLPAPVSLSMQENIGLFKYNILATGNQIQVTTQLDINYPNVSAEYYSVLKDFFQKMIEKQNEKLVLVKKI